MIDIENKIDESINILAKDFSFYPDKYLTEDDVRLHLCYNLLKYFGKIEETADGGQSIALHTEIRWYGKPRYNKRSDIVIFDVSDLCVTKQHIRQEIRQRVAPKKGYSAMTPVAAIELKLRRNNSNKSDIEFREEIEKDIFKLDDINLNIFNSLEHKPIFRVVALDKEKLSSEFKDSKDVKLKYISSKL